MDQPIDSVVFSLERGVVWASWCDNRSSVRLRFEDNVSEMMQGFLAQRELGKRPMQPRPADSDPTKADNGDGIAKLFQELDERDAAKETDDP